MSTTPVDQDAAAGAPRVGADCVPRASASAGTLELVAAALRICLAFLMALEEGRIADFPGNAYALGFLRSYAALLGLDPAEMTRRSRTEAADVNRLDLIEFPSPGAGPRRAYGGRRAAWHGAGDRRVYRLVPPVGQRRAAARGGGAGSGAPRTFGRAGRAALHRHTNFTTRANRGGIAVAVRPGWTTGRRRHTGGRPRCRGAGSAGARAVGPAKPRPPPPRRPSPASPAVPQPRIVLSATADAWLLVRDKSGPVLLNRVLHPGETWPVPPQSNLVAHNRQCRRHQYRGGRRHRPVAGRVGRGAAGHSARSG